MSVVDVLNLKYPLDLQLELLSGKLEVDLQFKREIVAGIMEQARRPLHCCVTVI